MRVAALLGSLCSNALYCSDCQAAARRLTLLDVVVGQGAAVLQLLAGEDQALLVRGDACAAQREQSARSCGGQGSRRRASCTSHRDAAR